jgi:cation diffusion facilitator CzcD-associated flavoprotein CzcO
MITSNPTPKSAPPVVIVGAGSAGLASAAALQRRGIHAVVLEQGSGVATSWRNRHGELRLNTIRWLSDLPGLRISRNHGRWVTRDNYIDYLEQFAHHQHLDIRFGVHVQRLDRTPGGWRLTTSAGDWETDQVVIATGYDRVPWLPDWPGRAEFPHPVIHVAHLRKAADLAGLRVLLVGAGNSGVEIAGHLVDTGVDALWVSVRTPPNILPQQVAGVPLHPLTRMLRILPERLRDASARAIARLAFGDLTPHGLPTPTQGPYQRLRTTGVTVAVDQGFVNHLKAARLQVVAEVTEFAGSDVVLRDGQRLRPDVVLAATGFRRGLEPLAGHLGVLDAAGLPRSGSGQASPGARGLWFLGYHTAIEGNLRQHPIEARRIARAVAQTRSNIGRDRRDTSRDTAHAPRPTPHRPLPQTPTPSSEDLGARTPGSKPGPSSARSRLPATCSLAP